ncbi:hypothetical protein [Marinomonas shanghaiensis]|uniref:hypothetical protein n=1 Tax=Marinomonas shanghaiensis TaxID=2202418 RepID=UPI0013002424|nr:hypothetical protein [Marinomonas shanghaiensis]
MLNSVISIGFSFDWIPSAAAALSFIALIMVWLNHRKPNNITKDNLEEKSV